MVETIVMYSIENIKKLRDSIEAMEQIHQIRILEICNECSVKYTENANGIFINMTLLDDAVLDRVCQYMNYVRLQQSQLDNVEATKEKYKKEFYKGDKVKIPC